MKNKKSIIYLLFLMCFLSHSQIMTGVVVQQNSNKNISTAPSLPPDPNVYVLTETKQVSIGVYDENDNLLKTLITNETKTAGIYYPPSWDGLNDDGEDVSNEGHHYLVVANAIEAEWEGVIGNSSIDLVGANKWKNQNFPKESLIIGDEIYFAYGSNEQNPSVQKADLGDYQRRIPIFYFPRIHPGFTHLAYDGSMLYMAGRSNWSTNGNARSYVSATTLANAYNYNNWHTFSSGTTVTIYSNTYKVADYLEDLVNEPYIDGLAVQTGNNNLFIFREAINSIHVIHKTTGALRQDITSYDNPKLGKIDSNGFLWFIHGEGDGNEVLEKFTINNSTGEITSTGLTLTGIVDAQAMNITPDGTTVVVGDMAAYDQFKAYSTTDLSYLWTLGRAESYGVDATVYHDKFMFRNHGDYNNNNPRYTNISFESDGSMWVIDEGNERFIKFDASRNYVDQIIWKSNFYSAVVDKTDPTRLFTIFLEYEIDYSKPIIAGEIDQAWKLVRNWGKVSHLATQGVSYGDMQPLQAVETLSNGRTYGFVVGSATKTRTFVEFVEGGVLRNTGVTLTYGNRPPVYEKGGIVSTYDSGTNPIWNKIERTITGFDASHNPILSSNSTWTSIDQTTNGFFYQPIASSPPAKISTDKMIIFDNRAGDAGYYHLAGYRQGETAAYFKTTKSKSYNENDPYPLGQNIFDVRAGINRAGSYVRTMDDWFIYGYCGENWSQTQTNYWHMLTEEGLFLYDFGTDGDLHANSYSGEGMAGNSFGYSLVKHEGQVYLYHNDESFHGGVHRWKINNLESIQKFEIAIE